MGSPQILGLPAALRKAKATHVHPTPQVPTENSLRKLVSGLAAQRRDCDRTSPGTQERRRERNQLDDFQDLSLEAISAPDMSTNSRTLVAAAEKGLGHSLITIHANASSQLLGNQDHETSDNSESKIDPTAGSLRGCGSSSTLRSFYDPQKIPLAVSQQTSNSSARDLALRKGCPPVIPTEKPDATTKSIKKKRSIRLELSMLFPKPSAHHDHLFTSRLGRGQVDVQDELVLPPAVPLGPSTSQKHQQNTPTKAPHRLRQPGNPATCVDNPYISKNNLPNPKGEIKYWFDNFDDEDPKDLVQRETVKTRSTAKLGRHPQPRMGIVSTEPEEHDHNPKDTFLRYNTRDPRTGGIESYLRMPPAMEQVTVSPAGEQLRLALQNWEYRSKHRRTLTAKNARTRFRSSRRHPFETVDLCKHSVLCLSSSDDESEVDEGMRSDIGTTIPGIRDSLIATPSDGSEVEIGTAHAIKTRRPKLEKDFIRRESQNQFSGRVESPLKRVHVPERQSSKMFSFLNDQPRSVPTTKENRIATPSEVATKYLRSSPTASRKHASSVRIITVTPQEESLLEAIRSKRVSMRQNIIAETFRRTSREEQRGSTAVYERPQTSGLDGNSSSFLHLSQDSIPTLSAFHNHRRSMSAGEVLEFNRMEPGTSDSTDLTSSNCGSLAQSSLLSPSSQESPPTPTLDPETDSSNQRISSDMKRYSTIPTNYRRHTHVTTGSNEVVILDRVDDGSGSHFQLDELPVWGFNGWSDTPGISVVH
jgi:hypothetical protein